MLSATVRSTGGKQLHCALWVNDVMHVGLFGTNYSTGSLNTVLQLKKDRGCTSRKIPDQANSCWEDTGLCFPDI